MPSPSELVGRDRLIRQITASLNAGKSVMLFGPEAIGKSAIIAAIARDGIVIRDPFEHVTAAQACRIRRALDRGVVYLGATRVARGRILGAVGRIMWRFSMVRVRELPDPFLRRIVMRELRGDADTDSWPEKSWVHEIATLAKGRPGFATAMARFALEWRQRRGYLPMPALAFAATREDATIRALRPVARRIVRSTNASRDLP